jgi:hypothetical protein
MVVYPQRGETIAYLDRFLWVVKLGSIEVTMWPQGVRVCENGVPVCLDGAIAS